MRDVPSYIRTICLELSDKESRSIESVGNVIEKSEVSLFMSSVEDTMYPLKSISR